jgi:hypothetical protein
MDRELHHQLPAPTHGVTYRRPTAADCLHVIREMRRSDVQELLNNPFNGYRTLREIVLDSVALSTHAWVACYNDVPFIMFGCAYANQGATGFPWLFGTMDMTKHSIKIVREAPAWLELFSDGAQTMLNIFDTRNTVHIQWAKRLGFKPDQKLNENYQYMVKYV